jgi:hypothetical protein
MGNRTAVVAVLALLALPLQAKADDRLARFDGGIGVIPQSRNGLNTVRGTGPGGQPWVISRLTADVRADGRISVDGRGLLLAGGDNIGFNGNQTVRARLFCGLIAFDSDQAVRLEPNGDFRIEGHLGAVPTPCDNAVLLIINVPAAGVPVWFAAGIPKL